jgi:hypothetical protein
MESNVGAYADVKADVKAEGKAEARSRMVLEMHREGIDKNAIAEVSHLFLKEVEPILIEANIAKD